MNTFEISELSCILVGYLRGLKLTVACPAASCGCVSLATLPPCERPRYYMHALRAEARKAKANLGELTLPAAGLIAEMHFLVVYSLFFCSLYLKQSDRKSVV